MHKVRKDDSDLPSSWASVQYANVLLAKLNESISTALWSAICKQCYAWEQWNLQKKVFIPSVVQRLLAWYKDDYC